MLQLEFYGKMAEKKLTLRDMSERGIIPSSIPNRPSIPNQLAYLFESLIYFFNPRKELEAKTINEKQAEEAERKYFCSYSRLRAGTYGAYANYATGKDRERFLRKARKAGEIADLIQKDSPD